MTGNTRLDLGIPAGVIVSSGLAQLTQGCTALGLLLVGHAAGVSVGTTSVAVAGYAVGAAVGRPIQARTIDRIGGFSVLAWCAALHAVAFVAVACSGWARSPAGLIASACLVGLSLPPIATWQRVHWPRRFVAPTRAFAVISLVQMVAVLIGPLAFGAVAVGTGSPEVAMIAVGAVAAASTIAFATQERSAGRPVADEPHGGFRRHLAPLLWGGLIGVIAGAVAVIAPAFAIAAGHPSVGALLVAAETVGGLAGGVLVSRRRSSLRPRTMLVIGSAVQVVGTLVLVTRPSLAVAALALIVEGLGLVPTLAATSSMIGARSGGSAVFFGWQSMAQALGTAAGSALAGALFDTVGLRGAVLVPMTCALIIGLSAARAPRAT